ncbi:hypothetical protein BLNAU_7738 [Blattamonas nauphoetae]|uniref:Uncharacterized protein n=1 Tax=Blattamonas nauphoetae TaxID=2049346 RepID=A0ABQ9Y0V1_9EUKA|nr:hypothetical protein BLNAU_7738 [Blattamonas nauphoetae]
MMILPPSSFRALHPVGTREFKLSLSHSVSLTASTTRSNHHSTHFKHPASCSCPGIVILATSRAKIPVGADGSEITKTHQSKPNDGGDQVHDLKKAGEDEGGASVIPIHVRGNTITPVHTSELVDELINPPMTQTRSVVWAGDGAEAEGDGKDQPCSAIEQKENFTIAADIITISLELPVNEVFLSFSSSNISRCVGETFNITNPGNHPANFHWEMDQTALLGNSSTDARVVQLPPASVIMHGSYIKEGEDIQSRTSASSARTHPDRRADSPRCHHQLVQQSVSVVAEALEPNVEIGEPRSGQF